MPTKIEPTVGRVVHYFCHTAQNGPIQGPFAAQIAKVNSDGTVNLGVLNENGHAFGRQDVPLVQEGETPPLGHYCCWMAYQHGQAAKTEALERTLAQGHTSEPIR